MEKTLNQEIKELEEIKDKLASYLDGGIIGNQEFFDVIDLAIDRKEQKNKTRLDYLRQEIEQERISQAEILELESLKEYIDPSDVLLLEWAGVPEFEK